MFTITSAPASASSLAGGPGSQMSSQTVSPMVVPPYADHRGRVADLEVAVLVEHAVVGQEHLAVDALHLPVGQHGQRVVDVLRVLGEADQRDHPVARRGRPPRAPGVRPPGSASSAAGPRAGSR